MSTAVMPRAFAAWRAFWSLDDESLRDAGSSGELLVARIRLLLAGILLLIPLPTLLRAPEVDENYVGLAMLSITFVLGVVVHEVARRGAGRPLLGFLTSALDVSLVSFTLAAFLVRGEPHTAVNSKVVFEVYFLALGGTCLRYDRRVCVVAGVLAMVQYAAIVAVATTRWELNSEAYAPFPYGMFSWSAQVSRLLLLGAATVLYTAVVMRTEHLRRLSTRDRLTGLFNRGHFDEELDGALQRAVRRQSPVSVALVDLDHFKQYNDRYGHLAGDAALRALARTLSAAVRPGDVVARYGGEEFGVLMPDTTAEGATAAMERLRRELAATPIDLPRHAGVARVTASVGIATWPRDVGDTAELVHRADDRLFVAKRLGRNCVIGPNDSGSAPDDGSSIRRTAGG
jgi:diguanylate cyclase (GGDEF)-like protein